MFVDKFDYMVIELKMFVERNFFCYEGSYQFILESNIFYYGGCFEFVIVENFYGNVVGEVYCIKFEFVVEYLNNIGFGK